MRFGGVLPADAPDPRERTIGQLRDLHAVVLGLVPQPHVEDWCALGIETGARNGVTDRFAAVLSYTFWRNPADRADPINLAELDDATRTALDTTPSWPRPPWLLDRVERMRYPMLWEAVRTSWHREDARRPSVPAELVRHVNNVLANRHHTEWTRDPAALAHGLPEHVDERHVERDIPVTVDGATIPGLRIDTDPFVLGIAADLGAGRTLTAVVDRDALPFLTIEFAERPL